MSKTSRLQSLAEKTIDSKNLEGVNSNYNTRPFNCLHIQVLGWRFSTYHTLYSKNNCLQI